MDLLKAKPLSPESSCLTTQETAHFFKLPRELRQSILLHTYDEDTPLNTNHFIDHFLERKDFIENYTKLLRNHPDLIEDVDYAKEKWQTSYRKKSAELKKESWLAWDKLVQPAATTRRTRRWWPYYAENIEAFGLRLRIIEWEADHPVMKQVHWLKTTCRTKYLYRILAPSHPANYDSCTSD